MVGGTNSFRERKWKAVEQKKNGGTMISETVFLKQINFIENLSPSNHKINKKKDKYTEEALHRGRQSSKWGEPLIIQTYPNAIFP